MHEPRTTSPATLDDHAAKRAVAPSPGIVQAETNLLRFPFFSLHTKGLKDIDFKEVRGSRVEGGRTHEFVFRVSRNTDHVYPGPLSRKVHFALLSLMRKQGFPFRNPVAFTWRQLTREMGIAYGGSTKIERLKEALLSTLGAMIKSSYALKCGTARESLPTRERGYTLYAECLFTNDARADGTVADQNYVTLADWYLANMNSLYAAPLDYGMWNRLNDGSPLASRLYEFLLFNFSAGMDTFTINYRKLCQYLPATVESYASQAKEQLAPALSLLTGEGIVRAVEWGSGRGGELQLHLARGPKLSGVAASKPPVAAQLDLFDEVTTSEGSNPLSPAERLVQQFHLSWRGGEGSAASPGEREAARECLELYGFELASQLLPRVVKRMRQQFPEAKTFGAVRPYFAEIHTEHVKRERVAEVVKEQLLEGELEAERERQRAERHARLQAVWEGLRASQREEIQAAVIDKNSRLQLAKLPGMLHRLCLDELEKRKKLE